MANDLHSPVWKLDTTGVISANGNFYVRLMRLVGATAGGAVTIQDRFGKVVFDHRAVTAADQMEVRHDRATGDYWDGFNLVALGSGVLYVYFL